MRNDLIYAEDGFRKFIVWFLNSVKLGGEYIS